MGVKREFSIMPRDWKGIRNNESAVVIEPDEWADARNQDSRMGWSGKGSTLVRQLNPAGLTIIGMNSFHTSDSVNTPIYVTSDGAFYEGSTLITDLRFADAGTLSNTSLTDPIPVMSGGAGSMFIARGRAKKPVQRQPNGTFRALTGAPGADGLAFEPKGPRIFVFPDDSGQRDTWAWSQIADFNNFSPNEGGGAEPVGEDREPLVGLASLGATMVIFKENRIYNRVGSDPASWELVQISSDVGCTAPNTIFKFANSILFAHETGMYATNALGQVIFPPYTFRIQKTWDNMIANFGDFLRYAHAAYDSIERVVYLWVPNQASKIMNRLIKIYLRDNSVTIHDEKDAASSDYFRKGAQSRIHFGDDNSNVAEVSGNTNEGAALTGNIRTFLFSGSPPKPHVEKRWGLRGIIHVLLEAETGDVNLTLTPRIHRANSRINGAAQPFTIAGGQVSKVPLKMPINADMGWGFDFLVESLGNTQGRWRLVGFFGEYEEITDA